MAKRPLWIVTVAEKRLVTDELLSIRLEGEALKDFPRDAAGDYIKLLLPKSPSLSIFDIDRNDPDLSGLYKRSYTVERVEGNSITLWVTLHPGDRGPAAQWIHGSRPGDATLITGPGPVLRVDAAAPRVLLAADLPGLAGVVANLRLLQKDAVGELVVEFPSERSLLSFDAPAGISVHSLVTAPGEVHGQQLVRAVRELPWPDQRLFVWAACEYGVMKGLRQYLMVEQGMQKSDIYLSSYWKLGDTDEQHKKTKHEEFPED